MAMRSLVRLREIPVGNHEIRPASTKARLRSTGRQRWSHVQPASKISPDYQKPTWHRGVDFEARFSGRDCTPYSSRSQCTRSKQEPRIISLQTRDLHEGLQTMRTRQTTEKFRKSYAPRAGIESTHAQAIRRSGLRRTRYRGLVKARLQHVITAVAINLLRISSWANGMPLAQTLCSHFAALQFRAA
jgi:hypothetical protein